MTLQLAKISQTKKRFHVSYLCTFAPSILSHIYYYRQSQYPPKSLAILLCDLPSDQSLVDGFARLLDGEVSKRCVEYVAGGDCSKALKK